VELADVGTGNDIASPSEIFSSCTRLGAGQSPILASSTRYVRRKGCAAEALNAGIAVAGWFGAKYAAYSVMTSANPPAGAVGWAVFGAFTAGYAAGTALASWYTCVYAS
jgi:hypothetical protein